MTTVNFDQWLAGISTVGEDHVFTPVGSQSERMTELLNERANLLAQPSPQPSPEEDGVPQAERSLAESYTARRDALDEEIEAQLEQDHPDAPRIRIRGLSDEDIEIIQDQVLKLEVEGKSLDARKMQVESNLRLVSRAAVNPPMNSEDVRILRRRLNRGEWARLLDHVTRLMTAEAEAVDLPNS